MDRERDEEEASEAEADDPADDPADDGNEPPGQPDAPRDPPDEPVDQSEPSRDVGTQRGNPFAGISDSVHAVGGRLRRTREASPDWLGSVAMLLGLAAVTVIGLQTIRTLFPVLGWYLRDTEGVPVLGLARYGAAPFVLSLLAPLVVRLIGLRATLVAGFGVLAGARLLMQATDSPGTLLWLSLVGVTVFLLTLPAAYSVSARRFAHAVALGLTADTAIRGLAWTLDVVWSDGSWIWWTLLGFTVLALVGALLVDVPAEAEGPRLGTALPMIGLGPLLFLELLILQNQGWVATQTGWEWPIAFLLVGGGNLVMILGVSLGRTLPGQGATGLIGGFLLLLLAAASGLTGILWVILFAAAVLGGGMALGALTAPVAPTDRTPGTAAHGISMGIGWVLFFAFSFAYYGGYDVALPIVQDLLIMLAGGLVVIFGLGASTTKRPSGDVQWVAVALGALLLAAPLSWWGDDPLEDVPAADADGYPLQAATYNVHSGYSTAGWQDLEALARAIEETGADVIGLQEVSRGWLLNGSTDLLGWLQRRLGFPYSAFHATTTDPVWGNAILSRFPLEDVEATLLPQRESLLRRGALKANVDLGDNQRAHFVVTHLHHRGPGLVELHEDQIATLLAFWDGEPRTILVGDFNAEPDAPQMRALYEAGFVDVWDEAGSGPGLTANAADPDVRIDYLLHSPDLRAADAEVVESQASDHFAVTARFEVAR